MIVCHCFAVRADEIRSEVRLGATTVEIVADRCNASSRCGGCRPTVETLIAAETMLAETAVAVRG